MRGIVVSDLHAPYQDKETVALVAKFADAFRPDEFVINGDALNYSAYSRHGKRDNESANEQINEDHISAILMLDKLLPKNKCNKIWIDGNHETFQDKYFTENPDTYDDQSHRYNRLKLKERGFKQILKYKEVYKSGKLHFTHGWRAGVNAVRQHLIQDYHANFVMGHIHKSDTATTGNIEGKVVQGYSIGCMCKLDWNYTMSKNSNQGFGIYYMLPNGNFSFYNIPIIGHSFIFEGQLWK